MTLETLAFLGIAFLVGLGVGIFYFGGLWWTVQQLPTARHPLLLGFGSFVTRTGLSLVGFYVAMGGQWERLLVCLCGFLCSRAFSLRCWASPLTQHPFK